MISIWWITKQPINANATEKCCPKKIQQHLEPYNLSYPFHVDVLFYCLCNKVDLPVPRFPWNLCLTCHAANKGILFRQVKLDLRNYTKDSLLCHLLNFLDRWCYKRDITSELVY